MKVKRDLWGQSELLTANPSSGKVTGKQVSGQLALKMARLEE